MLTSENTDQVVPALLAAQMAMPPIHKSADNPFYKSKYAPLDVLMAAALKVCHDSGLFISQGVAGASPSGFEMETVALHTSGQWISQSVWFPFAEDVRKAKDGSVTGYGPPTPQAAGASVTYARRYGLQCLLGIVTEDDDDGNAASGLTHGPSVQEPKAKAVSRRVSNAATEYAGGGLPTACPVCGGKIYDNRAKKASGEYKSTSKDWTCANKECRTEGFRTGGWIKTSNDAGPGLEDGPEPFDE